MSVCAGNCNGKCEGARAVSEAVRDTAGEQWSGDKYIYNEASHFGAEQVARFEGTPAREGTSIDHALAELNSVIDNLGKAVSVTADRLSSVLNHQEDRPEVSMGIEEACISLNSPLLDSLYGSSAAVQRQVEKLYSLLSKLDI